MTLNGQQLTIRGRACVARKERRKKVECALGRAQSEPELWRERAVADLWALQELLENFGEKAVVWLAIARIRLGWVFQFFDF